MLKEKQTPELYYNSAEDPLGQFMAIDGDQITFARENIEAELRREAIRYIGRNALPTMGRLTARMGTAVVRGAFAVVEHIQEQN
jgi:hypothetical protein